MPVTVIFQDLESESVCLEKNKMNGCHEIGFQIQHTVFLHRYQYGTIGPLANILFKYYYYLDLFLRDFIN